MEIFSQGHCTAASPPLVRCTSQLYVSNSQWVYFCTQSYSFFVRFRWTDLRITFLASSWLFVLETLVTRIAFSLCAVINFFKLHIHHFSLHISFFTFSALLLLTLTIFSLPVNDFVLIFIVFFITCRFLFFPITNI